MTARLVLESPRGNFDLNGIAKTGEGVQAVAGLTGLGLPSRSVQWLEGAGDGALFRGKRVMSRDIDIPLHFLAKDRAALKDMLSRFAYIVSDEVTIRLVDDDDVESWYVKAHLVGGGEYTYGDDTIGESDFKTVVTFRSGDPYWTSSMVSSASVANAGAGRGLLNGSLTKMKVAASQAIGTFTLNNEGDATAYPVWKITGPGSGLEIKNVATGERFTWTGTLTAGQTLYIDTQSGLVTDDLGANRYDLMGPAPRLWSIPPGSSQAYVALINTTSASKIEATWRARKWLVI